MNIPRQTRGGGLRFINSEHLGALESQAASHDKTDIARAEDNALFDRHFAEQIGEILRRAGGEYPCGAGAVDGYLLRRALAAARGEHESPCLDSLSAVPVDGRDNESVIGLFY